MKLSELREVARSQGLKGWTALRKNDLREFLISNGAKRPSTSRLKQVPSTSTPNTNTLLERIRELEEENRRLRQQQTVPTFPPTIGANTLPTTNTASANPKT